MGIAHGCWRACAPPGRSSLRHLQERLELTRITAPDKEAVRIMALGQRHGAHVYALIGELAGKRLRRSLAAAIHIGIKGQVDSSRTVAELPILVHIEMICHRAGDVVKTGLP